MKKTFNKILIGFFFIVVGQTTLMISPANGSLPEHLTVNNIKLRFSIVENIDGELYVSNISLGNFLIERGLDNWSIKKIDNETYQLKNDVWEKHYINFNIKDEAAFIVNSNNFGLNEERGDQIIGYVKTGKGSPAPPIKKVRFVTLAQEGNYISYNPKNNEAELFSNDFLIFDKNFFAAEIVDPKTFHIRTKHQGKILNYFWEIQLDTPEGHRILSGDGEFFGSREGLRKEIPKFRGEIDSIPKFGIFSDFGITNFVEEPPASAWIESKKQLYDNILKGESYDMLIVPFQVQGHAIDRVGRSMMGRYLSDQIQNSTDIKLPRYSLVSKALGESSRTFKEDQIYQLANDLRVKTIIIGAAGHELNEKMHITLLVKTRQGNLPFNAETETTTLSWEDIKFSDEKPPEEVFSSLLEEVIGRLPIQTTAVWGEKQVLEKEHLAPLPTTLEEIVSGNATTHIATSYYLQILGMLHPQSSPSKDFLFERSLLALRHVSPESQDYSLLKARALAYLHRRPAALTALAIPKTPAEKAFVAYLNGNLPELERLVNNISNPVRKYLAQFELFELSRLYNQNPDFKTFFEGIVSNEDWVKILERCFPKNEWDVQSNIELKMILDKIFPNIANTTAEDLKRSKRDLGPLLVNDNSIDLSVFGDFRLALKNSKETFISTGEKIALEKLDYLELLYQISESNLIREIALDVYAKGLNDTALQKLNDLKSVYRDHPQFSYLKGSALAGSWKGEDQNKHYIDERDVLYRHAYYWTGEQVNHFHYSNYNSKWRLFDTDYPARPFWYIKSGDRKEIKDDDIYMQYKEYLASDKKQSWQMQQKLHDTTKRAVALKYSRAGFYTLENCYDYLQCSTCQDNLIELNKYRFIGHPDRLIFLAKNTSEKGDLEKSIGYYEKAISTNPSVWEPYNALALIYIKQGNLQKASATYHRYPPFSDEKTNNRVEMSGYANLAAATLSLRGALDEATPFMKLAVNSHTGAASELLCAAWLAIFENDYQKAVTHSMRLIKRYDDKNAQNLYMTLLHLMGDNKGAWSLFNTLNIKAHSPDVWNTVFVAHRMERKSDKEIIGWLSQNNLHKVPYKYLARYIMQSLLLDRPPNQNIQKLIEEKNNPKSKPSEYQEVMWFSELYYHIRTGNFAKAFDGFMEKERNSFMKDNLNTMGSGIFPLPYLILSGVKSNKISEVEKIFEVLDDDHREQFYVHLAKAYWFGLKKKHREAIYHLRNALYNIPPARDREIFPWYQLVESCEWLYDWTEHSEYKKLALEWAKYHQRFQPMFAWAYAVEAKYTESPKDRLRALALTIYLDKNSERISGVSDNEKDLALVWLKENNPFLTPKSVKIDGVTPPPIGL